MDLTLEPEQVQLRDGARRFLSEQYSFASRRRRLADPQLGREIWAQFADLGWLAMASPEELGGSGAGAIELTLLAQELGRALSVEPFLDGVVLAGGILRALPASLLRDNLLSGLGTGEVSVAVALHEAGARYGYAAGSVVASFEAEGRCYLDGAKVLVSGGADADMAIVSAIGPEGEAGDAGLYLVTLHGDSCQRRSYRTIDGFETSDLIFEKAAAVELIGPGPAGALLDEALDLATVVLCAEAVGCMEAVIELTAEHLRTRKQFGKTLSSFQALQHRIAEMHVECEYAKAMIYKGLESLTRSTDERELGVSAAKIRVSQAGLEVGAQGIQLHGGLGMTEEYPVGHYYRRLLAIEKRYGDLAHHFERFERRAAELNA